MAKGRSNHIDTFLASRYTGEIDPQYIGTKFEVPIEKYYDSQWKFADIACNHDKGVLNFEVFTKK